MDTHNHFASPVDNTGGQNSPWPGASMYNGYPPNPSLGGVPPGWANGMSTSASPGAQNNPINHMNAMNPMSMMMSQLAMSNMMPNFMMSPTKPIGSAEDDILLVKTLKEAETTGMTYKQALDSLHSQNGHTSVAWKDYYLDHAARLNELVKKSAKKPTLTGSSISSAYLKASSTSHVKSASAVQPKSAPPKAKKPLKPEHMPQPRPPRRSSPPPDQPPRRSDNLPAFGTSVRLASRASKKNTSASARNDFVLPAVPSRAPSPPTKVVAGTNGNKFTAEDKVFFIEHLMYELNRDPSLTKSNLCTSLAAKAGHHTYASWGSFWNHNPHPADKILAYYHEQDRSDEEESEGESSYESSESSTPPPKIKQIQKRPAPGKRVRDEIDQEEMGYGGGPITKADKRAVAKHVATYESWDNIKSGARWKAFNAKYPQRSAASWGEMYRRYKDEIHAMVPKYRRTFDARQDNAKTYDDVDALENLPVKRVKIEPTD